MAVLALGAILYSCTERENPDNLMLEEGNSNWTASGSNDKDVIQIPSKPPIGYSENALIQASFTPISDVSGNYTTEATLLDISEIQCLTELNSVTDGALTLNFDKEMDKRQAGGICEWYGTYGSFPDVEGPDPHILYSVGQRSLAIALSAPVSVFGFELQPNFGAVKFQVDFFRKGNLIGTITRFASTSRPPLIGKGSLFAAKTDASFDYILIQSIEPFSSFSLGQFRYTLVEKNPFIVDVKPENCEKSVNVKSNGVIPVGILASMDLDVNDIDLSTVRLNGVAPKMSSIADLGGFYEKQEACDCDQKDFDGIMDLDLNFDAREILATLGKVTDRENVTVSLSFETMDGKSWTGEDCIRVIKKSKK